MEDVLLYFALKYDGDFDQIYHALQAHEIVDEDLFAALKEKLKAHYTTIISDDYPEALKYMTCPPFVLFYYGDINLAASKCIAVIGMRHPTEYGIYVTRHLVTGLVHHDYTIVSGMAIGIDGIAHRSAIQNGGHTIAVLGGGIDYVYPRSNQDIYTHLAAHDLVISEYPFDKAPKRDGFPKRNRIIAGLSSKVVVTQAQERSGTMITVGFALEQGKDVFAVPSRIDDPNGCNLLIDQGARVLMSAEDLFEDESNLHDEAYV